MSGSYYAQQQQHLQDRLQKLQKTADRLTAENAALASTEQVLCSLSHKQEWLLFVLQSLHERQEEVPHLVMAAILPASVEGSGLQLLRAATDEDWQLARTITPDGWATFFSSLVARLLTCQAMLQREESAAVAGSSSSGSSSSTFDLMVSHDDIGIGSSASSSSSSRRERTVMTCTAAVMKCVDEFGTLATLAHLTGNMMSYRYASLIDLSTGEPAAETPASHWLAAVIAARLTPQQVRHLEATYAFFLKQKAALKVQHLSANRGLALATERTAQQLRCSAAAATGAVPETEETAADKFERLLQSLHFLNLLVFLEVMDVLTPFQRMQWLIGSYPLMPRVAALLEAVCLWKQQQQQQQQQQRRQQPQQAPPNQPSREGASVPAAPAAPAAPGSSKSTSGMSLLHDAHLSALRRRQTQLAQQRQDYWAKMEKQLQHLSQATGRDVSRHLGLTR